MRLFLAFSGFLALFLPTTFFCNKPRLVKKTLNSSIFTAYGKWAKIQDGENRRVDATLPSIGQGSATSINNCTLHYIIPTSANITTIKVSLEIGSTSQSQLFE